LLELIHDYICYKKPYSGGTVAGTHKTKAQLRTEVQRLHQRIAELEAVAAEYNRAVEVLAESRFYTQSIVETVREPLVVLHADLRVRTANRAFYRFFGVPLVETENRLLYDLGNGQWNIPPLRRLLEEFLPQNTRFDDFEVEHTFPTVGRKTLLLSARRLEQLTHHPPLILLALEDITERRRAERVLQQKGTWLAVTLTSIGDAVIATDTTAAITFMNPEAERLTG
jgi:two-component system CheB/CheR fusion protein